MSARDLISDIFAAGEVDPHRVAVKAVDSADGEQFREFATVGAAYLARLSIHQRRSAAPDSDQGLRDDHSDPVGAGARWVEAAQHSWDLTIPYRTEDGWKPLAECTRADVLAIASGYDRRAAENATLADRFRGLERSMRAQGASTVGDLDRGAA